MSTEKSAEAARQVLTRADDEREIARWADDMQNTIRLGRPIKLAQMLQRGPFGRKRQYLYELDDRMPHAAVNAIYRALSIVRHEAESNARDLEARITTSERTR